jgi:hypothetical protein
MQIARRGQEPRTLRDQITKLEAELGLARGSRSSVHRTCPGCHPDASCWKHALSMTPESRVPGLQAQDEHRGLQIPDIALTRNYEMSGTSYFFFWSRLEKVPS